MNKSFTLIEILVVIVVIGVLSAFILVGMSSITSSANIAKGRAFSNSLRNSLLINLVSEWKLDDLMGGSAPYITIDSWKDNNGTLGAGNCTQGTSTCPSFISSTLKQCVSGACYRFDGVDDYINCGNNNNLRPASFTVEAWANADIIGDWNGIVTNFNVWGDGFGLQVGTQQRIAMMVDNLYLKTNWAPVTNTWYHIVGTFNSSNNLAVIYVNGKNENNAYQTFSYGGTSTTCIGVFYNSGSLPFNGKIDEVRIYNEVIQILRIEQNYFLGINKLYKNKELTKIEFNQRLVEIKNNIANNE
jgi:prepilin-type N-terminal cleavage/methylation domain-containing protein